MERGETNDEMIAKGLPVEKVGGTGEYPGGMIRNDDLGELAVALAIDRAAGRIHLSFGTRVAWISMTADEAIAFAENLYMKGKALKGDR